jgi:hypothetical protein
MEELERLARQFHEGSMTTIDQLWKEIRFNPQRFRLMTARYGDAVGAARYLLDSGSDTSSGLQTLWRHQRLEDSVEASVLNPTYKRLFTEQQRETACRRLRAHDFDVAAYLRTLTKEDDDSA